MSFENSKALWWKFQSALTEVEIDKILEISKNETWQSAEIGQSSYSKKDNLYRSTDVKFINDQWLFDLFWPYMETANKNACWNLEISMAENFQLGRYGLGGHYNWHVDGNGLDTVMEGNMVGLSRKISMVCWLNEDFEGGDFEIHKAHAMNENIIKPSKGTIIFFPAWTLHKVYPVTKGERFSLVTWFCGQPVK